MSTTRGKRVLINEYYVYQEWSDKYMGDEASCVSTMIDMVGSAIIITLYLCHFSKI